MVVVNSAVITERGGSYGLIGKVMFGFSFARFFVDRSEAELRCYAFFRRPNAGLLASIWNLPEEGAISRLKYVQYPCITTNEQLHIPRIHQSGTIFDIH